jgi:hypothetical protein
MSGIAYARLPEATIVVEALEALEGIINKTTIV